MVSRSELEAALREAGVGNLRSDSASFFQTIVSLCVDTYGVNSIKLADKYGVSVNTINRWKEGVSVPNQSVRSFISNDVSEIIYDL